MSQSVLSLLRKIVERGFVLDEELSEAEREIVRKLVEKGVLKVSYTVSREYLSEIVELCKPKVVTVSRKRRLTHILRALFVIGIGSPLMYFGAYGLALGYVDVAAFFIALSLLVMYGASYLSKRLFKAY